MKLKLKCIGGVHDGEYVYVDSYYRVGDCVQVAEQPKLQKIENFHPNEINKEITIKYELYKIDRIHFSKDDYVMFLIPYNWTCKEAFLFQLNK